MFPVEAFQNTLQKLVEILQQHEISFHLTGGVTSIAYSEPRMTQDIGPRTIDARLRFINKARSASEFFGIAKLYSVFSANFFSIVTDYGLRTSGNASA